MTQDGAANVLRVAALPQDFAALQGMVRRIRIHLVVEVVDQAHHAPLLLAFAAFTETARIRPHARLDGQRMLAQAFALRVLAEQLPGRLTVASGVSRREAWASFHENLQINCEALRQNAEHLTQHCDVVIPLGHNGHNGEIFSLTPEEQQIVARTVAGAVREKRKPVIVGVRFSLGSGRKGRPAS